MKELKKGTLGYIDKRKQRYLLLAILEFAMVLAVFLAGVIATKTRMNAMTVVAAVGCLPASKMLVEYIVMFPFHSAKKELAEEVLSKSSELTSCFDLLVSQSEKCMSIDAAVITSTHVCAYSSDPKVDTAKLEKHLKAVLRGEGYDPVSVRVLTDYKKYLKRVEELNKQTLENHTQYQELEVDMRNCLLSTCM
ncbi:MAG: hypothetical protein MJ097_01475 [Dorea sp.]|nr:hypothetical protein [Dorea sp.]